MSISATSHVHGPLFDGRVGAAIADGASEGVLEVAKEGRGDLGVQFIKVFKHPTGAYESTLDAQRVSKDVALITDHGEKVYNHWLEGTGSRNYPVTRFKGYQSWAIVEARLREKAGRIVAEHIAHALKAVGS